MGRGAGELGFRMFLHCGVAGGHEAVQLAGCLVRALAIFIPFRVFISSPGRDPSIMDSIWEAEVACGALLTSLYAWPTSPYIRGLVFVSSLQLTAAVVPTPISMT